MKSNKYVPADMTVGSIHDSNGCGEFEVISYTKSVDVVIRFKNTGYTYKTNVSNIRSGRVSDKTHRIPEDMRVGSVHTTNKGGYVEVTEYINKNKIRVRFLNTEEEVYTTAVILRKGTLLGEGYTPIDMRCGFIHKTNNHGDLEIVKYTNAEDVTVRFLNTGLVRSLIRATAIRGGKVWDTTRCRETNNKGILLCGVGFNDADYAVRKNNKEGVEVWCCPYYAKWKGMLMRCYNQHALKRKPSYIDCTVCEEWLTFSNFKDWMIGEDHQGKHLDKDLLVEGNKVYSPSTCIFIGNRINTILNSKFDEDVGAYQKKHNTNNKYYSVCSNPFNIEENYIGVFDTKESANLAHKAKKVDYVKYLAKEEDNPLVTELLFKRFNIEQE